MDSTSMKPHPDLLTKARRKALGNGIGVKLNTIEAALQTCQDMADYVVLVFVFYYYFFMSIVDFFSPLSTDNVETSEFSWQLVEVPQGWGRWRKCWWTTKWPTGSPADAGLRSWDLQDLPPHCPPRHPPFPHPSYAPTEKERKEIGKFIINTNKSTDLVHEEVVY